MEVAGSNYLLAIAQIAVSFVGFSTIVVSLRQATGSNLSEYHILLFRFFIEAGLAVTALALVPSLLGLFIASEGTLWPVASVVAALGMGGYMISYVLRRRRAEQAQLPNRLYVYYGISILLIVALVVAPGPGLYAAVITWTLLVAGLVFLHGLPIFFHASPTD